ncbi:sodium:neurotransmitter symporter family protein [Cystoisospora suis]|uniref:Sodium:neurotransmitter symporter family protein n=1 Tax=Cystoisospora suis TaxID=483139 RepID=A0A2C6JN67_9APIC|nr:sodium:neurotransmitter symporter family protein [Cystoisospora suis]
MLGGKPSSSSSSFQAEEGERVVEDQGRQTEEEEEEEHGRDEGFSSSSGRPVRAREEEKRRDEEASSSNSRKIEMQRIVPSSLIREGSLSSVTTPSRDDRRGVHTPYHLSAYPVVSSSPTSASSHVASSPASFSYSPSLHRLHTPTSSSHLLPPFSHVPSPHNGGGVYTPGTPHTTQPVEVLIDNCAYRQQDFFLSPSSFSRPDDPFFPHDQLENPDTCPVCTPVSPILSPRLVRVASPSSCGQKQDVMSLCRKDSLPPVNRMNYYNSRHLLHSDKARGSASGGACSHLCSSPHAYRGWFPSSFRTPGVNRSSSPPSSSRRHPHLHYGTDRRRDSLRGHEEDSTETSSASFPSLLCPCFKSSRHGRGISRRRRSSPLSEEDDGKPSSSSHRHRQHREEDSYLSSSSSSCHVEWDNRLTFVIATIGAAVGIGCVWRFPTYCYKFGGGIFLVPYLLMLFILGIPIHTLEMSLGQVFRGGQMKVLNLISPRLRGLACATILQAFFICSYYSVFLAWGFQYLLSSFHANLPWTVTQDQVDLCSSAHDQEACYHSQVSPSVDRDKKHLSPSLSSFSSSSSSSCVWIRPRTLLGEEARDGGGGVCVADIRGKAKEYFFQDILGLSFFSESSSGDVVPKGEIGLSGYVVLGLFIVWIQIYFSLFKGLQSLTVMVYAAVLLPIASMIFVTISSLTLDGSSSGLRYLFLFDWATLIERPEIWGEAASQVFFSLGVFQGVMAAYASHKKKLTQNTLVDTLIVSGTNTLLSFISGVCTFSIAGHVAKKLGSIDAETGLADLSSINLGGSELVFILYPISLSALPFLPQVFCLLFFISFCLLGITSAISFVQPVIGFLTESKALASSSSSSCSPSSSLSSLSSLSSSSSSLASSSSSRRRSRSRWMKVTFIVSCIGFLLGIPFCMKTGIYLIDTADYQWSVVGITFIGTCECIAFGWIYGLNRQVQCLGGSYLPVYLYAISYLGGIFLAAILLFVVPSSAIASFQLMSYRTYIILSILLSVSLVLTGAAVALYLTPSVVYQKTLMGRSHATSPSAQPGNSSLSQREEEGGGGQLGIPEEGKRKDQEEEEEKERREDSQEKKKTENGHCSSFSCKENGDDDDKSTVVSYQHPLPSSSHEENRSSSSLSPSSLSSTHPNKTSSSHLSLPPRSSPPSLFYTEAKIPLKTRLYWLYIGNIEHLRLNLNAITASNSKFLYLWPVWSLIIKYLSPLVLTFLLFHELGRGAGGTAAASPQASRYVSTETSRLAYQASAGAVLLLILFIVALGIAFPQLFDGLVASERKLEPRMIVIGTGKGEGKEKDEKKTTEKKTERKEDEERRTEKEHEKEEKDKKEEEQGDVKAVMFT